MFGFEASAQVSTRLPPLVRVTAGTGLVVARLAGGEWSAPIAVATLGLSWGLQLGAALADVMVVFMKPAALLPLTSDVSTSARTPPLPPSPCLHHADLNDCSIFFVKLVGGWEGRSG